MNKNSRRRALMALMAAAGVAFPKAQALVQQAAQRARLRGLAAAEVR